MSHRMRLAVALTGMLATAGVVGWFLTRPGTQVSTVSGTVVSMDRSTSTLVIAPTTAQPDRGGCDRQSRPGSPPVICAPSLPSVADVDVRLKPATRVRHCAATKCRPASLYDIGIGRHVVVTASMSADGLAATQVSISTT